MQQGRATGAEGLSDELVRLLIDEHQAAKLPVYGRLWDYYRNTLTSGAGDAQRPYAAAQEQGLPPRLARRSCERVIENDIGWRLHAMVDFMFGKPVAIESLAPDARQAALIQDVLNATFDANGGAGFFQNLALLGGVYGFVDVVVRGPGSPTPALRPAGTGNFQTDGSGAGISFGAPSNPLQRERAMRAAQRLVLETVEAPRAIPVPDPSDYRRLAGYIMHYAQTLNEVERGSWIDRVVGRWTVRDASRSRKRRAQVLVTEIWTDRSVRRWHDGQPLAHERNGLGVLPVVHIQNLPQPLFYEGLSEVEPLIGLQDELNTRLSDRANRVTLQSFKMYLGKGIEDFAQRPIGPGQMWTTDNMDASIESFGGDAHSPPEESHINEVRDAMDKISGVTPLAAGLLRNKVGNLTSENALRVTLMGLLAKTQRKRVTYGRGIEQVCELVLRALDVAGALRTTVEDRRVCLHWPSPLPEDTTQRLRDAQMKLELGVPQKQVLAELGYCGDAN